MKTKFIVIFIVAIIVLVGGIGFILSKDSGAPSKYDEFAKALKEKGAVFYGAFWCPHCQTQKAEFGSAKKYLPYVECSNVDNTQKPVCLDKKIEGYPTWQFRDGIKIVSAEEPTICPVLKEGDTPSDVCKYSSSEYYPVWIFSNYKFSIKSPVEPIKEGDIWSFPADAQAVGEVDQSFLAEQIQFTLPK